MIWIGVILLALLGVCLYLRCAVSLCKFLHRGEARCPECGSPSVYVIRGSGRCMTCGHRAAWYEFEREG